MKKVNIIALCVLGVMFMLMLASAWNDSAIIDELAHIPAGFGYVTQRDYRLNPEHPPLVKALSALFAQIFVHPHFPIDTAYWRDEVNGQWAQGATFLYESGNDADAIIFWSRLPLMLLAVLFGWLLFSWTKKRFGTMAALSTLTFFAFSPTILAHSRLVTTDLGAALGFFIGIASFIAFLENPDGKRIVIAGLLFGIAQLLKFSVVLLLPIDLILLVAWVGAKPNLHARERLQLCLRLLGKMIFAGAIALAVIWTVYGALIARYPQERQLHDAEYLLGSYGFRPAVNLNLALIKNPLTRPLGEYVLGVLMVQQRSAGGNTAFFLGEVSGSGSRLYFPLLYLLKEPLALHLLTLIAFATAIFRGYHLRKSMQTLAAARIRRWIADHFTEFSCLTVIIFYWAVSVKSPLNIGIRHMLPTFPFIYILISREISQWLRLHDMTPPQNALEWFKNIYQRYITAIPKYLLVAFLMLWLVMNTLISFPGFLSYYNELAVGSANGWRIAVDSNYDWGQDLKRLEQFVENPPTGGHIKKISLDYFGGGSPRYYLGDRFEPWWSARGQAHGYFAISATFRQGAFGTPAPGFIRKTEDSYEWLKSFTPIAQIGNSIFVYKLP